MSILTFLVIISVVFITLIAQLAVVRIWAVKYEKDNIEAKYNEISMLLNTNNGIIYDELFENMDVDVIIYNKNKDIIYNTMDEVPSQLQFDTPYKVKSKVMLNFEHDNIILNAPININGKQDNIYIFNKTDTFYDYLEATIEISVIIIVLVIVISVLAGMYISKKFVNKLKK